ncbi:MAG: hypothetical protein HQK55_19520 [Deltaproteobacteria bacterium]|nr:hypothetical protein [Deltaproteobacteria bacterium]
MDIFGVGSSMTGCSDQGLGAPYIEREISSALRIFVLDQRPGRGLGQAW